MGRAAHASNFRTRESEAGGFGAFETSLRYRFRACLTGIKTLLHMSSLLGLPSPHYFPSFYSFFLFRDRTWLCCFGRLELTRQSSLALNTAIPTASVSHQWGIKASPSLPSIVLSIASFSWWSCVHVTTVGTCCVSIFCTLSLPLYNSPLYAVSPDWSLTSKCSAITEGLAEQWMYISYVTWPGRTLENCFQGFSSKLTQEETSLFTECVRSSRISSQAASPTNRTEELYLSCRITVLYS